MNVLWLTKKALVESSTDECNEWGFTFMPLVANDSKQKTAMLGLLQGIPNYPQHVMCNYGSLNTNLADLLRTRWDAICVDEVHNLKGGANAKPTQTWTNLKKLIEASPNAFPIFLSGSIVNNKPEELWAYLHLFNPTLFPSLREFSQVFTFGNGVLNINKLIEAVAPNMIRRTMKEAGEQMREKHFKYHKLELEGELKEIYKQLSDNMFLRLEAMGDKPLTIANMLMFSHYTRNVLIAPGRLKYNYYPVDPYSGEVGEPQQREAYFKQPYVKLNYAFELGCEIMDEGQNVIIYTAQYNIPIEYLAEQFKAIGKKVLIIKGETKDVRVVEREFQQAEGNCVLLCNLMSGAEGLNLQTSDKWPGGAQQAIFLDRWWNPERNRQGENRVWRPGNMYPATIHILEVKGTIDLVVRDIEERKVRMRNQIVDAESLRAGDWAALLKDYLK